jgi:predicted HAD superfamily Cof-like phosphohydrolase
MSLALKLYNRLEKDYIVLPGSFEAAFDEVHNSNMSKLGKNGKPIYRADGKVLKGENYFKPNLKQFLTITQIK